MTPHSANSSTSQFAGSPQPGSSHPAHRYHHSSCAKPPSSPRPLSRAMGHPSRQDSPEATRQPALSAFLLERLQKERRAEGDKISYSASLSRADMSASVDLGRQVLNSPFKPPESDGGRPRSSAGTEQAKRKGLGVKEMEQVCTPPL